MCILFVEVRKVDGFAGEICRRDYMYIIYSRFQTYVAMSLKKKINELDMVAILVIIIVIHCIDYVSYFL